MSENMLLAYSGIPRTALVMGGDWDHRTSPEDLVLSPESRLRVLALGALGSAGLIDTAIFTAGLTRGPNNTPEAAVQHQLFDLEFPELSFMKLHEEDLGHTTRMDAIYTRQMVQYLGLDGPYTLITTKAFKKRQTTEFEHHDYEIVSLAAEPIVATLSQDHAREVQLYRRSMRHIKHMAREPVLRLVQRLDPDSNLTEYMAARSRPNHNAA